MKKRKFERINTEKTYLKNRVKFLESENKRLNEMSTRLVVELRHLRETIEQKSLKNVKALKYYTNKL